MVLVLKVYLHLPKSRRCEIRRISTTSDILYSYNLLCCKIAAIYPYLNGKTFLLFWKDDEGDDIVMSTDQELAQAVANASNDVLKIHVRVTDDDSDGADCSINDIVHPNVVCDACNQVVKGNRYKCLQCEDFDLCSSCNTLDKHPAHDMVKLVSPSSNSRAWFFRGWRSMWQSMFSHEFPGPSPCHWQNSCKKNEGAQKPQRCPWMAASSAANKDTLKMIGQTISSLLSPFGVEATVDVVMSNDKEGSTGGKTNTSEGSAAEDQPRSDSSEKEGSAKAPENGTLLSTSIGIATSSISPKVEKEQQEETPATDPAPKEDAPEPKEPASAPESEPTASQSSPEAESKSTHPVLPDPAAFFSAVTKAISSSQATNPEGKSKGLFATLEEAAKAFDDWTIVNTPVVEMVVDHTKIPETKPKVVGESAPSDMKDDPKTPDDGSSARAEGAAAAESQANIDEPVTAALNAMLNMGFSNEGEWLLKLLQAKNGNVNDALDALYRR